MRLSHQIERYILTERQTTVAALSRYFGITESRCMEELAGLVPFGVEISDGAVHARGDLYDVEPLLFGAQMSGLSD